MKWMTMQCTVYTCAAVHCRALVFKLRAVATVVGTFAMCEHSDLCTIHCAQCTLCTLCTVQCSAVRIGVSNWGRRGWWVGRPSAEQQQL